MKANPNDIFAQSNLTRSQFNIWLGQQLDPHAPLYHMAVAFEICGPLDAAAFRRAFQALVEGSDALRTVISGTLQGVPRQEVREKMAVDVPLIDFSLEDDPAAAREQWLANRPLLFDLSARLFDSALLQTGPERFTWYFAQHHLITDGFTMALVQRRMAELYALARENRLAEAPQLPQYHDYVAYEAEFRRSPLFGKICDFWQQKTAQVAEPLAIYGKPPAVRSTRTRRIFCDIGAERTARLKALAAEAPFRSLTPDLSLYAVFATLMLAFLHRVSGQDHIRLGTPAHNRPSRNFKETIGLFIELFPLEVRFAGEESFATLAPRVLEETHEFLRHTHPGTSAAAGGDFNAVLNFIPAAFGDFAGLPLRSRWLHPGHGDRGHTLRLQVHDLDQSGSLQLHFDVNTDALPEVLQQRMPQDFLRLVDAFIANREQPLARVDLLSDAERQALLIDFNRCAEARPQNTVIAEFEARVQQTPAAIAVRCGTEQMTCERLNARANELALRLKKQGVLRETPVAVCLPRCPDLLVSLLAVLKSGGAFVPIDPTLPPARIKFMLRDSGAAVLLTHRQIATAPWMAPQIGNLTIIPLDSAGPDDRGDDAGKHSVPISPDDLAYIIYTSGSTGQPRGVLIEHGALWNYLRWARAQYQPGDMPLFTTIAADLTLTSIFLPLISGRAVHIYPEESGVDAAVVSVVRDDAVDLLKLTPAHLALVLPELSCCKQLKKLILGGENLATELARSAAEALGGRVEIFNEYGPTEATVGCMIHRFDPRRDTGASVPIGQPAAGAQIYLLDRFGNPVPPGMDGEIYIGGPGLARGYHNHPELTAARFVKRKLLGLERPSGNTNHPIRLYRTGDRARRRPDGTIEFLGRIDHQVKLHGFRIEPGEIEAALLRHPAIRQCVVEVRQPNPEKAWQNLQYCKICGLASNHPDARIDADGVCRLCREFEAQSALARQYFKSREELQEIFERARAAKTGKYDCLMLFSGGKDSTYALYQVVEMGMHPLVFSMDNGYISEQAQANIRRVVEDLGLDLHWGQTPAMKEIFRDSLKRFSNVCNGCFKTIYTLSMQLARQQGIRLIVTGLSRGQFFETRVAELFKAQIFDPAEIDRNIVAARKAYHRMPDAVSRCLDVSLFRDDRIFEEIEFVDFYRFCDVSLAEMMAFLRQRAPWVRPDDTGRSTNCLINDVGIYIHKKERGFHNYALPYSWDVRLGHKQRAAALEELNDEIDEARVQKILDEIGYRPRQPQRDKQLVAYLLADPALRPEDLRGFLAEQLPAYMIPAHFISLAEFPLNATGKVDRAALPDPFTHRLSTRGEYRPPRNAAERLLAQIWAEVLEVPQIGIHDNFFDLGGDSMVNIRIVARAADAGLQFTPGELFQHPTIAGLAAVARQTAPAEPAEPGSPAAGSVKKPLVNLDAKKMDKLEKLLNKAKGKSRDT